MIKYFHLLLLIAVVLGCSPDGSTDDESNSKAGIESFKIEITSPIQTRDYSFHHPTKPSGGYEGVFSNPAGELTFTGEINVTFNKTSEETEIPDFEVLWRSSIDGILHQGKAGEGLQTDIKRKLSKGIHTVYLEASIPGTRFAAKDSLILSNTIELKAESTGKSIALKWSKYEGQDFLSYLIYRQDHTPVVEIQDINTLEYMVAGSNSFIAEHEYQVIVRTSNNYDHPVGSNISLQHQGIFVKFPHFIHKIIKDPLRSKVYAIVGPEYSHYDSTTFGLLIIDVGEENFQIDSHILQDQKFADLDISPDGQNLFLVQKNVDQITKLNLDRLEAETFVTNTNGWGFHKIEVGKDNTLYCHRNPPTSGSTGFWIFDGNNGDLIRSQESVLRHGDIEYNSSFDALYGGESNTSNGRMYKYNVTANSIVQVTPYPVWPDGITYPWSHIFVSDDDQYILWENFQLDPNLNVIRTFETTMKISSPGNKYLSNYEELYDFNSLEAVYKFPILPITDRSTMVFMDDETVVMARAENTGMNQEEYTYFFRINL
ncbi:hypothetical protein ACXYMT_01240 [Salinimicrobium sp. CAU 1759]